MKEIFKSIIKKLTKKRNLKLFLKRIFLFYKRIPTFSQKKWFEIDGDNTLRLDYSLNKNSVFVEVGGYKGYYSKKIFDKFEPKTFIFEPDNDFYNELSELFKENKKVKILNKALGKETEEVYLAEKGDSSFIKPTKDKKYNYKKVEMISFNDFLRIEQLETIDLISINIEGGEYELLQHIIDKKLQNRIKNIQVQFHKNIQNSKHLKSLISNELSKTHSLEWSFKYVWESWKIKNNNSS